MGQTLLEGVGIVQGFGSNAISSNRAEYAVEKCARSIGEGGRHPGCARLHQVPDDWL